MTQPQHSPLPWTEDEHAIYDASGHVVYFADNRDFIVRAVNMHARLIEELQFLATEVEGVLSRFDKDDIDNCIGSLNRKALMERKYSAFALLAKAKGA